jgi:thymidylate synthase (FAD)
MWPRLISGDIPKEDQARFISEIMESGHASPIEHVSFTFAISGVSRALTHQLVRHRVASYSQQSQRYVAAHDFDFIMPPAIAANHEAQTLFADFMRACAGTYARLRDILDESAPNGKSNEDARFILPQAASTAIVVSMNCRSLINFFEQRVCARAQWEIRHVASLMLGHCREILPSVFTLAGARCERLGYCPEGEKFCCGRYPVKNDDHHS